MKIFADFAKNLKLAKNPFWTMLATNSKQNRTNFSLMAKWIESGNSARVLDTFKARDPDCGLGMKSRLLVVAVKAGDVAAVTGLLALGADANHGSALSFAAERGDVDVCKVLVDNGAEVNPPGMTPLLHAAKVHHDGAVAFLVASGALKSHIHLHKTVKDYCKPNTTTCNLLTYGHPTYVSCEGNVATAQAFRTAHLPKKSPHNLIVGAIQGCYLDELRLFFAMKPTYQGTAKARARIIKAAAESKCEDIKQTVINHFKKVGVFSGKEKAVSA
eukprot:TRINITY_DN17301_c0_g2_i1.p1 TRINITY_DN17301_c0_g2~~TRINITY_DN17301_c0_g2_i1.p1  ORF type:complete len:273 (+),score=67.19 TRINITY_DN17301_c0_g2_i1:53-871(+)